jgi:hypothetical protein
MAMSVTKILLCGRPVDIEIYPLPVSTANGIKFRFQFY